MHRLFCPITPQKRTHSRLPAEEHLLSPIPNAPLPLPSQRKNNHLELLLSPTPIHRDLFSQLLATAKPPASPSPSLPMDEEYDELDCLSMREEEESCCEDSFEMDESGSDEGVKKRKRKSTAQIKMLKQELEEEPNWSKEKIVEMSDLTGLSQSQVYKWWWDQKKKTTPRTASSHSRDPLAQLMLKRKQIRKDLSRRPSVRECEKENAFGYEIEESAIATKVKANVEIQQLQDTERKVNKRLVFY